MNKINKLDYSYHNHTYRCGHASGSEELYIKSAIDSGIKRLGISDHAPFKGISVKSDRMDYDELDDYFKTLNDLKEKYSDQIDLKIGFEVEYISERLDEIKALRKRCDYLLLGQHNMNMRNGQADEFTHYTNDEDVLLYAKMVCEGMETGLFAALNHPEYFMLGKRKWNSACEEATIMICECAKRLNIPLEVNLKGVRKSKKLFEDKVAYAYPYREFWLIASKYGNDVIVGHDAHAPLDFMDFAEINKAEEILEGIDLHFIDFII